MANPTITATAEPENVPPRVRINIVDTGTPAVTEVTVMRLDPDGRRHPVRTQDGGPFGLTTSGSDHVGVLFDYEPPYGQPVTYTVEENPATAASVTLNSEQVWLIHPGVPSRSVPITITDLPDRQRQVRRGVFYPLGGKFPIVVTDGRRKAASGQLRVRTETDQARIAMDALLEDAQILLLNVPAGHRWGVTTMYLAIDTTRETRFLNWGPHPYRNWDLPYAEVARPAGGAQSQWSLADVQASYATLVDVKAAYATLADLQANVPIGG